MYRILTQVLGFFALLGIIMLFIAILVVVADIILRHSIDYAILGTVDITQLCVMAVAFWSIPFAFLRRTHVTIELSDHYLSPRAQQFLDGLAACFGCILLALITYYGWGQAVQQLEYGDQSQTLGIPLIYYWGFLLSGGGLACIATLFIALQSFTHVLSDEEVERVVHG